MILCRVFDSAAVEHPQVCFCWVIYRKRETPFIFTGHHHNIIKDRKPISDQSNKNIGLILVGKIKVNSFIVYLYIKLRKVVWLFPMA